MFANGLVSGALAVGSIIGPQTFRAKDAPQYIPAKIIVLVTQAAAVLIAVIARLYYGYQNSRKEKAVSLMSKVDDIEWLNCKSTVLECSYGVDTRPFAVTDKENKTFRYQY